VQDIADQLSSLKWLQQRLVEQCQAVATAGRAEDLSRKRYAGGLGTTIQVLSTQNAVLVQRRQLVVLESRAFALQANLSRALGGGYAPSVEEQHAAAY
jgi:outer membrane protein TolC